MSKVRFFFLIITETLLLVLLKILRQLQSKTKKLLKRKTRPKGNASNMYLKAIQVGKIKYLSGN